MRKYAKQRDKAISMATTITMLLFEDEFAKMTRKQHVKSKAEVGPNLRIMAVMDFHKINCDNGGILATDKIILKA